jgi:hypothetical protein
MSMARYLAIDSNLGKPSNSGLRESIIYIGKHYGKLANKTSCKNEQYLECGMKYIAKHAFKAKRFGILHFRKVAIRYMFKSNQIKNDSGNRRWYYHKRMYVEAYDYIIYLLLQISYDDNNFIKVKEFLNNHYKDICNKLGAGKKLDPSCSNALIYWQKKMLELHISKPIVSISNRKCAGNILDKIAEVDKPLSLFQRV